MGLLSEMALPRYAINAVVVVQWTPMLRGWDHAILCILHLVLVHTQDALLTLVDVLTLGAVIPLRFFREAVARHWVDQSCRGARQLRTDSILKTRVSGIDLAMAAAGGSQGYATVEPAAVASVADIEEACWAEKGARQISQSPVGHKCLTEGDSPDPPVGCAQARRRRRRQGGSNAHPNARSKFSLPPGVLPVAFPGTAKNGTTMWGLWRRSTSSGLT